MTRRCFNCKSFCKSGSCGRCKRWNDGVVLIHTPFIPNYKLMLEIEEAMDMAHAKEERHQKMLELTANGEYAPINPDDYPGLEHDFECPLCHGSYFGATDEDASCHDEYNLGCRWDGKRSECFVLTKRSLAELLLAE